MVKEGDKRKGNSNYNHGKKNCLSLAVLCHLAASRHATLILLESRITVIDQHPTPNDPARNRDFFRKASGEFSNRLDRRGFRSYRQCTTREGDSRARGITIVVRR